ncbi:glycosyltransferase family 2 protein [Archaeoglobus sp.]|uniref:glycosyltransferase n=1 Tax=Archaeoglobus sp. TaxID=1872626 RepID=UPI0025C69173|nr:glycosyltransferase family 2 protein [Archaeoglobus sp.]
MKTAVISIYKNAKFLEENIRLLKKEGFDVILAVDEPEDDVFEIMRKYNLKATISEKRRGKWRALNDAAKMANGELLLFLDSDTVINNLSGVNGADVVEVVKEVKGEGLLEKLVAVDYLVMAMCAKLASKFGSCLGVDGAAFLIKKRVFEELGGFKGKVNEDTELGVRAALRGYRFAVCGKAFTASPKTFGEWFRQRERWSVGGAEVFVENIFAILLRPRLWVPYLVLFYPAIFGLIVSLFFTESYIAKLLYLILPFFALLTPKLASVAMLAVYELENLRNLIAGLMSFIAWSVIILA